MTYTRGFTVGHSGWGEASGGVILLLPWGLLILRWWLWVRHYHKMPCCMGQIQWAPARPHLPLISHHLQRKSLHSVHQKCHAPCKRNLDPNGIRLALPTTQWPSYDSLDVRCYLHDLFERMQLEGLAKVLCALQLRWHGHVERSDGWLKKVQKLNPTRGRGRGHPKKTWTEVIDIDCLVLGLAETHPSERKAWSGRLTKCCQTGPTPLLGTDLVQYKLNLDDDDDHHH